MEFCSDGHLLLDGDVMTCTELELCSQDGSNLVPAESPSHHQSALLETHHSWVLWVVSLLAHVYSSAAVSCFSLPQSDGMLQESCGLSSFSFLPAWKL